MSTAPHRPRIMATRHMAAAGHYLAAQASLQVLEGGGNAVDAGVAGGIALAVLQSEYVSFGGVAPIMIRLAATGEVVTISGVGPWPRAARLEHFHEHHGGRMPPGILRTVVPAAPDAWITALERFGTMSFGEVAGAAERFASEGFPIATLGAEIIATYAEAYAADPEAARIYLPGGEPPRPGDRFVQADLGRTLRYLMDEEAAQASRGRLAGLAAVRDAFYRGDVARAIVRFHETSGGWLRAEDLDTFRVDVEPARTVRFKGADLHVCGAWCQGPVLGQAAQILDGIDLEALGRNSAAYVHHMVEAFKLAYADRHHLYGDPKVVDVPLDTLLDPAYATGRRALIDARRAIPGMPPPGLDGIALQGDVAGDGRPDPTQLDTSYICVVDGEGNAFSATPSDASAGAPLIPGLGLVVSSRGGQSWTDPSSPAVLAPGKRPRLTPNPAIAVVPGEWVLPFGSPGNDMQPQAMLQALANLLVWQMTPQAAVEAPRFGTSSFPRSTEPHAYDPDLLHIEGRFDDATIGALGALGHDVRPWPAWAWASGAVCAILASQRTGLLEGAADPRRPTGIAGW